MSVRTGLQPSFARSTQGRGLQRPHTSCLQIEPSVSHLPLPPCFKDSVQEVFTLSCSRGNHIMNLVPWELAFSSAPDTKSQISSHQNGACPLFRSAMCTKINTTIYIHFVSINQVNSTLTGKKPSDPPIFHITSKYWFWPFPLSNLKASARGKIEEFSQALGLHDSQACWRQTHTFREQMGLFGLSCHQKALLFLNPKHYLLLPST